MRCHFSRAFDFFRICGSAVCVFCVGVLLAAGAGQSRVAVVGGGGDGGDGGWLWCVVMPSTLLVAYAQGVRCLWLCLLGACCCCSVLNYLGGNFRK